MDIATIIGLLLGSGLIGMAMAGGAGGLGSFIDPPSALIVIGGTAGGTLVMFPLGAVFSTFKIALKTFIYKVPSASETISTLEQLAIIARKDGLLALEKENLEDEFLAKGIRLLVDGTDQNSLRSMLETEIRSMQERHAGGSEIFDQIGALAPAFGMIGTLVGLVQMLKTLSDPSAIGPSMAIALITTLYGALIANMVCIPFGKKLAIRSREETIVMELAIEGIISVAKKENPNLMKAKLNAYLAPNLRVE